MTDAAAFTEEELERFNSLTRLESSLRQMDRIESRLALRAWAKEDGEEKLVAMMEELKRRGKW